MHSFDSFSSFSIFALPNKNHAYYRALCTSFNCLCFIHFSLRLTHKCAKTNKTHSHTDFRNNTQTEQIHPASFSYYLAVFTFSLHFLIRCNKLLFSNLQLRFRITNIAYPLHFLTNPCDIPRPQYLAESSS